MLTSNYKKTNTFYGLKGIILSTSREHNLGKYILMFMGIWTLLHDYLHSLLSEPVVSSRDICSSLPFHVK